MSPKLLTNSENVLKCLIGKKYSPESPDTKCAESFQIQNFSKSLRNGQKVLKRPHYYPKCPKRSKNVLQVPKMSQNPHKISEKTLCVRDPAEWLEHLTANAKVATVQDSIPASFGTNLRGGR
jgi:hypothetical protein